MRGLVGGKLGGIDLGRRLVLLLREVEFEDALDVDLGDPMLVHGHFFRAVLSLVFAVTQPSRMRYGYVVEAKMPG
jgi:hypothetical protein